MVLLLGYCCLQADKAYTKVKVGFLGGWSTGFSQDIFSGDSEKTIPTFNVGLFMELRGPGRFGMQMQLDIQGMRRKRVSYDEGVAHLNILLNGMYHFPRKGKMEFFIKGGVGGAMVRPRFFSSGYSSYDGSSTSSIFDYDATLLHLQLGMGMNFFEARMDKSLVWAGLMLHYLSGHHHYYWVKGFYISLHVGFKL